MKMLVAFCLALLMVPVVAAESNDDVRQRFSYLPNEDNIPPGCDPFLAHRAGKADRVNPCHAIATSMNGLDTPKIDVLLMVPVSPTAERDLRIMRQSVQMWADGLKWMSNDMGLHWLSEVVEFRISTQFVDGAVSGNIEYAITDPEIVIIVSNPVGGIGIGVDPQWLISEAFGMEAAREGLCHGIDDPFNMARWQATPGFDSHHGPHSGTYVEDCDGKGGNICFSVNGAIDPDPTMIDFFQLYDLISHENGHCLTLGHVGDGAEGSWDNVPSNDIMAYSSDPPGKSKCVSSLNVEGFAVSMSRFIDTNGDERVDEEDRYYANDAIGEGDGTGRPFQLQHPHNHHYASPTRMAKDCPQPSFSPVPLQEVKNFTPTDVVDRPTLALVDATDGKGAAIGPVNIRGWVNGSIDHLKLPYDQLTRDVLFEDSATDGQAPYWEIQSVHANMTDDLLTIVMKVADLRPDDGSTYAQYGIEVNGQRFNGFTRFSEVKWDHAADTVTWTFDREKIASEGFSGTPVAAPYQVRGLIYVLFGDTNLDDAPEQGEPAIAIGDALPPADAPYILLHGDGFANVTVPIRADGTFSGNVDFTGWEDAPAVVQATWFTRDHVAIDSDRVLLNVDADIDVHWETVRAADAGIGSQVLEKVSEKKSPGLPLVVPGLLLLAMVARSTRRT